MTLNLLNTYLCSLMAKPFVILSGGSGTGKTRMAIQVAETLDRWNQVSRTLRLPVDRNGRIVGVDEEEVLEFCQQGNTFEAIVNGLAYPVEIVMCTKVETHSEELKRMIANAVGELVLEIRIREQQTDQKRYELVAVGADWTDSKHLLGYVNPFGGQHGARYELTPATRLILRALHPDYANLPFFLILDEMNLSHVERYFSPILSLMEANRSTSNPEGLSLLTRDQLEVIVRTLRDEESHPKELETAEHLLANAANITLPPNLFIVGTVNVDETTYMFSPKVLDRAHVIEIVSKSPRTYFEGSIHQGLTMPATEAIMSGFEESIRRRRLGTVSSSLEFFRAQLPEVERDSAVEQVQSILVGIYHLLKPVGFDFGYRTISEVLDYLAATRQLFPQTDWKPAVDLALLQKILPKLHGNKRQLTDCLKALEAFMEGQPSNYTWANRTFTIDAPPMPFPDSADKVRRMQRMLEATGYTSFIT